VKKTTNTRRRLLKSIMVGGGLATTSHTIPQRWSRPVVDTVVLPAHAQTSAIEGDFGGSGVAGSLVEAMSVLDMIAPRAYAGGIQSTTELDVCASVNGGDVTLAIVRFNQSGDTAILPAQGLPVAVPGSANLDVSASTNVITGSIQFDGPGNNGLAGRVMLDDGGSVWVYPFDLFPGGCQVKVFGP
jgi:hypothetical protein